MGMNTASIRTMALAFSYSTAEYACTVWERATHTKLIKCWMMHVAPSQDVYISLISITCIYYPLSLLYYKEKYCCTKRKGTKSTILNIHYMATQYQRNAWNQEVASYMSLTNWLRAHPLDEPSWGQSTYSLYPTS